MASISTASRILAFVGVSAGDVPSRIDPGQVCTPVLAFAIPEPRVETLAIAHIAVDPSIRGGRPHLAGTRMTVGDVALLHLRLGQPLAEIAGKHDVSLGALHAAMAYYYDHRSEIDSAIEEDAALEQASRQDSLSPLQEKLAALRRRG